MKHANKFIRALVMVMVVCAMLTSFVFAAGEGSLWIRNMESAQEGQTDLWIVTDTTVTDGMVELNYDAETMTYVGVETDDAYVAMFSVNNQEPGVVKIAWVAPGEFVPQGNVSLMKVVFEGKGQVTGSGAINGGESFAAESVDTSELEKAILEAEGLYEDDYTDRSWKTLEMALELAREVLADPTADQGEVNAAAETLNNGMASLELKVFTNNAKLYKAILRAKGLCEDKYTAESWNELEDALSNAKKVYNNRRATQKQIDDATNALNEAIDNLELKPVEPEQPEQPDHPGYPGGNPVGDLIGKWVGLIKKFMGGWFGGWGN